MANVGYATLQVIPTMKGVQGRLTGEMAGPAGAAGDKAGRTMGERLGVAVGKAAKRTAQAGMLAIAGAVTAAGVSGLRAAANFDQTERVLGGLYGSAEAATDMLGRLRDVARNSPIQFDVYAKGAESLAYMGFQGKEAAQVLENLGLAITAGGGGEQEMGRATDAMLKMVNAGKVQLDTLNQLSDAGAPIFSGLAAHFNTNIANVREMVSAGKIGIDDVMSVMQNATGDTWKQMNAAGAAAAESLSAQWKIATDNIAQTLGQLLLPIIRRLGPAVGRIGEWINEAIIAYGPKVAAFAVAVREHLGGAFAAAWPHIRDFALWLGDKIYPFLTDIANFTTGTVVPAVLELARGFREGHGVGGDLADTLSALASAVKIAVEWISENRTVVWAAVAAYGAWKAIAATIAFGKLIAGLGKTTIAWVKNTVAIGKNVAAKAISAAETAYIAGLYAKDLAVSIIRSTANLVRLTAGWIANTAAVVANRVAIIAVTAAKKALGLVMFIATLGRTTLAWTLNTAAVVAQRLALITVAASLKAATAAQWLLNAAMRANPIGLVIGLLAGAGLALGALWQRSETFRNIVTGAFDMVRAGAGKLGDGITWLWRNAAAPALDGIGSAASWAWNSVIKPAFDGIRTGVEAVGSAFSTVKNTIETVWEGIKAATRRPINWVIHYVINGVIRAIKKLPFTDGLGEVSQVSPADYAEGGWTGPGSKYQPAGIVHADEFVTTKWARRRMERNHPGALDYINRTGEMPGYAEGGRVRSWPVSGSRRWTTYPGHTGIDFPRPHGTPVFAAHDGPVTGVSRWGHSYGHHVRQGGEGGMSIYAHLSSILARVGQFLRAGQILGLVGSTGNSTGNHLHYERRPPGSDWGTAAFLGGAATPAAAMVASISEMFSGQMREVMNGIEVDAASAPQDGFFGEGQPLKWIKELGSQVVSWVGDQAKNVSTGTAGLIGLTSLAEGLDKLGLFDDGGLASGKGAMLKDTVRPERVLSPRQTRAFEAALDRGFDSEGGDALQLHVHIDCSHDGIEEIPEAVLKGMRRARTSGLYPRQGVPA